MNGKTIVTGFIILLLGVGAGYYFSSNFKVVPQGSTPVATITSVPTPTQSPSTGSAQITTPTPTVDEKAALLAAVKAGLAAEHGPDANSLNITVSKIQGNFAQGGASASGGGGMWFAAKVGGTWKLVWDGNGTISCTTIDPYNFPTTMIPECWNETTQKSVTR